MRLAVRTAPGFPGPRRYRAGLGPFSAAPVAVEATEAQAAALAADPMLLVDPGEELLAPEGAAPTVPQARSRGAGALPPAALPPGAAGGSPDGPARRRRR